MIRSACKTTKYRFNLKNNIFVTLLTTAVPLTLCFGTLSYTFRYSLFVKVVWICIYITFWHLSITVRFIIYRYYIIGLYYEKFTCVLTLSVRRPPNILIPVRDETVYYQGWTKVVLSCSSDGQPQPT